MRKTFFTLSLLAASLTAAAQYEKNDIIITPMAGASIAWMAPNATSSGDEYYSEFKTGCYSYYGRYNPVSTW